MKNKEYIKIILTVFLILFISNCYAYQNENKEEFVYELSLWNGKNFDFTFCPQAIKEIYMIADEYNIFNLKKTQVYYWPMTKEYKANWYKKNEMINGSLEILKNNKVIKNIEPKIYSFKYNTITQETELLIEKEAQESYNKFEEEQNKYLESIRNYYMEMKNYEEDIYSLPKKEDELKRKFINKNISNKPKMPKPLREFVSKPKKGFILKIDKGEYEIIFRDEIGKALQGIKKKLIVFTKRRSGIGYKMFSEKRWIDSYNSNELGDILYLEGNQTVFIKPFNAVEYPELGYSKISRLSYNESRKLSKDVWNWTYLSPRCQEEKLELIKGDDIIYEANQKSYYIKQIPGYALGYEIVEALEDDSNLQTFSGYKIEINNAGKYIIRMIDKNNNILVNSIRQIRPIFSQNTIWLFLISIIPILIGIIILLNNKRHKY